MRLIAVLAACFMPYQAAFPEESRDLPEHPAGRVEFIELDDADCAIKGGKLVALQHTHHAQAIEVWVDRWFMQVKTADHTRHKLLPWQPPVPLGCSMTVSGEQHWTLYSATPLE